MDISSWKIKRRPTKIVLTKGKESIKVISATEAIITTPILQVTHTYELWRFKDKENNFSCYPPDFSDVLLQQVGKSILISADLREKFKKINKRDGNRLSVRGERLLDTLIINDVSIPILLYSALEAFVNQRIYINIGNYNSKYSLLKGPFMYQYKPNQYYDQLGVQRYVGLKDKLFKIIPSFFGVRSLKEIPLDRYRSSINTIIAIRDRIVHQKISEDGAGDDAKLLEALLEMDGNFLLKEVEGIIRDFNVSSDL